MHRAIAIASIAAAILLPLAAQARTIALADVRRIVDVSSPKISPDGGQIVCLVVRPDYADNDYFTDVVLVDVASGSQRVLTHGRHDVSAAQWSPKGGRIAFIARDGDGDDAQDQIFVMPMDGGDARKATSAPNGVEVFAWRPDGNAIAYASADEPANKAAIAQGHDYFEIHNDAYLTTAAPTPIHIWLAFPGGAPAQRVTAGSWSLATPDTSVPLSWSPDGRSLVLARVPTPHSGDGNESTVVVVDVTTRQIRKLTSHNDNELYPDFSPDGSKIAYWYPKGGDYLNARQLIVAPAQGGDGVDATADLDRDVNGARWMPDGRSLLVGADDGTRVSLWLQPLAGPARKLDLGDVNPYNDYWVDMTVGNDGAIAFAGGEPKRPTELYYLSSANAKLRRLTDFNAGIASLDMGETQTITWQGPDGFGEDGVITYPPGFVRGKKYPLVMQLHGGPDLADTTEFWDWLQLVAAHGYIVFRPNYRGSDNLGSAYQRALWNDAGDGAGRDIMAGLAAVEKLGSVDSSRIAVGGWSYGGYMTAWLISHYPTFRAAVLGAAYMDGVEDYDLSDSNVSDAVYWKGSPWVDDHLRDYRAQSAISYWKNIKTPTLILSNTGDVRVPITMSYAMYHALKDNHVPVKFIAWPESGHEISGPVRLEDRYRLWLEWLDHYLT